MKAKADLNETQVPLNEILIWPHVVKRYQLLSDLRFMLRDVERISEAGVKMLLKIHPILVVVRRKQHFCVCGFRILNIATLVMSKGASIPVHQLAGISNVQATDLALADLFLTPLSLSLAGAENIDTIRQKVGDRAEDWTELATCPLTKLAKALGMSAAALLYHERKKRPSGK